MSYTHKLAQLGAWLARRLALGCRALKQIASVLQTASFARLRRRGIYYYSRRTTSVGARCAQHARLRTTSIAAARLLARSPQTSIPQVQPRVDAAKREALAGRRYVITETG